MRKAKYALTAIITLTVLMSGSVRPSQTASLQDEFLSEYLTFWSGTLRIYALEDNTLVTLYDLDTGELLDPSDPRIEWTRIEPDGTTTTNPFVLPEVGDSFEGRGGRGRQKNEIRVRIKASDADDETATKPVLVWTGALAKRLIHPPASPSMGQNPWMAYIPGLPPSDAPIVVSRELGREFLGFTTKELYVFARKGDVETEVRIEDIITNMDLDDDDTQTLGPADAVFADDEIEIFYLDQFEDDTIRISSNVDISALVGIASQVNNDWTTTPPSYGLGDEGRGRGTLFYTFVNKRLTVFPLEDDTTVTITDLSDGDDTKTVRLVNGDTTGSYDFYTPSLLSDSAGQMLARLTAPTVNIITNDDNMFEQDFVKVESDKPILVHVGPVASDTNEFANISRAVPIGPDQRIFYAYAQNFGGSADLQIFGLDPETVVNITSLTRTDKMRVPPARKKHHDFSIGPGIDAENWQSHWRRGTVDSGVWWGSGVWNGEVLRIESNKPIIVLGGDYDVPNFGHFAPFFGTVGDNEPRPPIAQCRPEQQDALKGTSVEFDGSESFDQDAQPGGKDVLYQWDHDLAVDSDGDGDPTNDVDSVGPVATVLHLTTPEQQVQLTFFDDEGESDTDICVINSSNAIEINKVVVGVDDGTHFDFTFNDEPFSLMNGESRVFGPLDPRSFTISETVPDRWLLSLIECDNDTVLNNPDPTEVTIDLTAGGIVACTFTNEYPTAVELISLTAQAIGGGVTLRWETASELDNEGFNVLRSQSAAGPYTQLNARLLPAQGNADAGASYEFVDSLVAPGVMVFYKLEDVDINGSSTFHGPVATTP